MTSLLERKPVRQHNEAEARAQHLRTVPARVFRQVLRSWEDSVKMLWEYEDPQAVLDLLGEDAAELFDLSGKVAAFLETVKPECTQETRKLIKDFTLDGKTVKMVAKEGNPS